MKIVKILEEIKELDINMEEMVTIKLMNDLGGSFETYLTMLSQKARDENKLPDLPSPLSNLEDEERRMEQTAKVNLAQSQSTSSGSTSSRGGSSSRAQSGRGGGGQSHSGKEGVWLRLLLQELGHITAAPTVFCADNQGSIALAENPEFQKCSTHIDTKFHWV